MFGRFCSNNAALFHIAAPAELGRARAGAGRTPRLTPAVPGVASQAFNGKRAKCTAFAVAAKAGLHTQSDNSA